MEGNNYAEMKAWAGDNAASFLGGFAVFSILFSLSLRTLGADYLPNAAAHIGTMAINGDAQFTTSTSVTLSINAVTNSTGGVAQMQFSNGNDVWSAPEPYQRTRPWQLFDDGTYPPRMNTVLKTVYVRFQDLAGAWTKAVSDSIILARSAADVPRIKQLYIAQQQPADYDGTQPLGSRRNPYLVPAASNETQFDTLMHWLMLTYADYSGQAASVTNVLGPATNSTALTLYLGPGIYETHGDNRYFGDNLAWSPQNGWRLCGAGKDVTILKAVDLGTLPTYWGDVIGGYYGDVANYNNFELRDLTVDANLHEPGTYNYRFSNGVTLVGNNVQIRRIKIKNFGTTIPGAESGGLGCNNFGSLDGSFNLLIEDCDVVQAQAGNAYKSGMMGALGTFGSDGTIRYWNNLVIRNCYIDGAPYDDDTPLDPFQYAYNDRGMFGFTVGGTRGAIIEDNLVLNTVYGYYIDSSGMHDLVVRNNHFRNVIMGAGLALGAKPSQTNFVEDVFVFDHNLVELQPRFFPAGDSWGSYGWRLGFRLTGDAGRPNGYIYNHLIIRSNTFQFTDGLLPEANVGGITGYGEAVRLTELETNLFRGLTKALTWNNDPEYLDQQVDIVDSSLPPPMVCLNNLRPDGTVVEAYPYVLDKSLPRPVITAGESISFPVPVLNGLPARFASGVPAANPLAPLLFQWGSSPFDAGRYVVNFYLNTNRTADPRRTLVTVLDRLAPTDPQYFANGLMAFWKFDESSGPILHDSSGNGLNLDATPALNRFPLSFGVPGYVSGKTALQFNISTVFTNWAFYIRYTNSDLFGGLPVAYNAQAENQTRLYHSFSTAFWFKSSSKPTRGQMLFADAGFTCSVGPGTNSSAGTIALAFGALPFYLTADNLAVGAWHHAAVVYDGVSGSLYVDGAQAARAAFCEFIGAQPTNTTWFIFGGGLGYDNYFGALARIAIWSRPLRAQEITRIYSEQLAGVEPLLTPLAPSNLSGSVSSGGGVTLNWQDNSRNETAFVLERSADGTNFSAVATLAANVSASNDTPPQAGAWYFYRVKATNGYGDSAYSNVASIGGGKPSRPTGVHVVLGP